ncbi:MAG: dGTP triphosphohydrolase [Lentisphaeria bacterium]
MDYVACKMKNSNRKYIEAEHGYRNEFQRDRDRVIHSKAFRQLEAKTQVFINGVHNRIRTRLTHTIEVSAIARTLARALGVNEDLAETIALAHDLGHSPFGHGGEVVLNELMGNFGGFEHNRQSLKIVDELEIKYPHFMGLNLTWGTRSGLVKHRQASPCLDGEYLPKFGSIEAQIADIADDLTYLAHDIDDGLSLGLLNISHLRENVVWLYAEERAKEGGALIGSLAYIPYSIRCFIDNAVADVVAESKKRFAGISKDSFVCSEKIVEFSEVFRKNMEIMKKFMYKNLYYCDAVKEVTAKHANMLRVLFDYYCRAPELLEGVYALQLKKDVTEIAVCDYISSLNDIEAKNLYLQISNK